MVTMKSQPVYMLAGGFTLKKNHPPKKLGEMIQFDEHILQIGGKNPPSSI